MLEHLTAPADHGNPGHQLVAGLQGFSSALDQAAHRPQGNPLSIPDRPPRQQSGDHPGKDVAGHFPPEREPAPGDALARLVQIAGEDWDSEDNSLHSLSRSKSSFACPQAEGYFPDPEACSVYYQCAHGTATTNTCQADLK